MDVEHEKNVPKLFVKAEEGSEVNMRLRILTRSLPPLRS